MKKHLIIFLLLIFFGSLTIMSCKKSESGDGTAPEIVILGLNPLYWALDMPYEDTGAIAYDVISAGDTIDISNSIIVVNNVDVSRIGDYSVTYNVEDESGESADEKIRIVKVVMGK